MTEELNTLVKPEEMVAQYPQGVFIYNQSWAADGPEPAQELRRIIKALPQRFVVSHGPIQWPNDVGTAVEKWFYGSQVKYDQLVRHVNMTATCNLTPCLPFNAGLALGVLPGGLTINVGGTDDFFTFAFVKGIRHVYPFTRAQKALISWSGESDPLAAKDPDILMTAINQPDNNTPQFFVYENFLNFLSQRGQLDDVLENAIPVAQEDVELGLLNVAFVDDVALCCNPESMLPQMRRLLNANKIQIIDTGKTSFSKFRGAGPKCRSLALPWR